MPGLYLAEPERRIFSAPIRASADEAYSTHSIAFTSVTSRSANITSRLETLSKQNESKQLKNDLYKAIIKQLALGRVQAFWQVDPKNGNKIPSLCWRRAYFSNCTQKPVQAAHKCRLKRISRGSTYFPLWCIDSETHAEKKPTRRQILQPTVAFFICFHWDRSLMTLKLQSNSSSGSDRNGK